MGFVRQPFFCPLVLPRPDDSWSLGASVPPMSGSIKAAVDVDCGCPGTGGWPGPSAMALVGGGSVRRLILVGIGIALLAGEGVTLAMNDRAVGSRAVIAQETEPNSPADVAGPVEIA